MVQDGFQERNGKIVGSKQKFSPTTRLADRCGQRLPPCTRPTDTLGDIGFCFLDAEKEITVG